MKVLKALLLASALALPITAIHAATMNISVEAASKKKAGAKKKKVKKAVYKHCGTFKYWKAGKCLDARNKK